MRERLMSILLTQKIRSYLNLSHRMCLEYGFFSTTFL